VRKLGDYGFGPKQPQAGRTGGSERQGRARGGGSAKLAALRTGAGPAWSDVQDGRLGPRGGSVGCSGKRAAERHRGAGEEPGAVPRHGWPSGWARLYRAASAHAQGPCTGTHGVGAVGASRAELPKTAQPGVVSSGASKSPAETAFEIATYMSPVGHDFIPF
jgi:hypothetical protein